MQIPTIPLRVAMLACLVAAVGCSAQKSANPSSAHGGSGAASLDAADAGRAAPRTGVVIRIEVAPAALPEGHEAALGGLSDAFARHVSQATGLDAVVQPELADEIAAALNAGGRSTKIRLDSIRRDEPGLELFVDVRIDDFGYVSDAPPSRRTAENTEALIAFTLDVTDLNTRQQALERVFAATAPFKDHVGLLSTSTLEAVDPDVPGFWRTPLGYAATEALGDAAQEVHRAVLARPGTIRLVDNAKSRWWVLSPVSTDIVHHGTIYYVCRWDMRGAGYVALNDAQTGFPIRARIDLGFLERPSAWIMGVPEDPDGLRGATLCRVLPDTDETVVVQVQDR